jgi:hypothetical protein
MDTCTSMYVCMYVSMYVCMYVCMYVYTLCVFVCVYIRLSIGNYNGCVSRLTVSQWVQAVFFFATCSALLIMLLLWFLFFVPTRPEQTHSATRVLYLDTDIHWYTLDIYPHTYICMATHLYTPPYRYTYIYTYTHLRIPCVTWLQVFFFLEGGACSALIYTRSIWIYIKNIFTCVFV